MQIAACCWKKARPLCGSDRRRDASFGDHLSAATFSFTTGDELTQVFVEHVADLADVSDAAKTRPGPEAKRRDRWSPEERVAPGSEFEDPGEAPTSE